MSFEAMAWAAKQAPKNTTSKLCLLIMSSMANQDGKCWPSHKYLADQCLCSKRNIVRVLNELSSDGYISIEHQFKGREFTSNMYTVSVHKSPSVSAGSDTQSLGSDRDALGGSDTVSPKTVTSFKQSNKPLSQNEFDQWWTSYPKKVKKKDALKKWNKIQPDADLLIADTKKRILNDDNWKRGFVPDPTTYLNGERWNDDIQKCRTGSNGTRDKAVSPATANREAGKEYFRRHVEGNGDIVG